MTKGARPFYGAKMHPFLNQENPSEIKGNDTFSITYLRQFTLCINYCISL